MVFQAGGEITFHAVPDRWVEGLPIKDFTRKATWYRIALDELLPDADRVLWLDADLLVKDSLSRCGHPTDGHISGQSQMSRPVQTGSTRSAPNLGVTCISMPGYLLVDLAAMRHEGTGPDLREFAVRAHQLKWRDQDVLNEVLHGQRLALHPRWNCMNSVMQFSYASDYFPGGMVEEARRSPAIRHFEGPSFSKPWHLLADEENRRQYIHHRRQTPWPGRHRQDALRRMLPGISSQDGQVAPVHPASPRIVSRDVDYSGGANGVG